MAGLANEAGTGDSLETGQGLSQFSSGFNRRRGGIAGRFSSGVDPSGLKGTYYRDGMPSPTQGDAPKLSSFADKSGRGTGVNFFKYGAGIKGGQTRSSGNEIYRASSDADEGLNDSFSGKATISGFTTKISRGMSTYSDFGSNNGAIGATADASYYRSGNGQFDTERYKDWMANLVGTQGTKASSSGSGVLGNSRQGVK